MSAPLLLLPAPRKITLTGGICELREGSLIVLEHILPQFLLSTAHRFQGILRDRCGLQWDVVAGGDSQGGLSIRVHRDFNIPEQGYELIISSRGITIDSGNVAGAFYGICTLIQIVDQCGRILPCMHIRDWPDFLARGVMLDVSRERVPTMETLYSLVDQLAGWKINQLQLYTEHAFAYRRHPEVWEMVTPITGQEVMELDLYCQERCIELVPNQQSFGHLAPWLNRPKYKHLAEVENGFQTPWGYREGSFSLSPVDPRSIEFLRGLYEELLPHFSSDMFNIGCDETWDLGQGRSKEACERYGRGRVYLNFLLQVYHEVKRFNLTPQFWADIVFEHPELIPELPSDMIALEWGYEAEHPFNDHAAQLSAGGIPFYVCPGTSSWSSLSGRTDNAIKNLLSAARNGIIHDALGYLITDWGDYGHWQPWPVSYLGWITGAGYSWALESNRNMEVAKMLSWFGFRDPGGGMGKAAFDLGNVYKTLGIEPHNSSLLFWFLQWPLEKIRSYPGLTPTALEQAVQAIEAAASPIQHSKMDHPDAGLVRDEFSITQNLLRHACWRGQLAFESDALQAAARREVLDVQLSTLIEDFRRVWLRRNRPGGLHESIARLERLHADYKPPA